MIAKEVPVALIDSRILLLCSLIPFFLRFFDERAKDIDFGDSLDFPFSSFFFFFVEGNSINRDCKLLFEISFS